jgi:hypothetical protein
MPPQDHLEDLKEDLHGMEATKEEQKRNFDLENVIGYIVPRSCILPIPHALDTPETV